MQEKAPFYPVPGFIAAMPLAVFLALDAEDSLEPASAEGRGPQDRREEITAVFPRDDASAAPVRFAHETPFDSEAAPSAGEWPGNGD